MEGTDLKNLENFRKLTARYFHTLKPTTDKTETYIAQVKFVNYYELGCVITNMLKLCVVALNQDTDKDQSINVGQILETALQMFPMDEFEFLSEISKMLAADYQCKEVNY